MRVPYFTGCCKVASPYGERRMSGRKEFHYGIDLVGAAGDRTLVAPCAGVVAVSGKAGKAPGSRTWEWGEYVRIDAEGGFSVYLCHMEKRVVSVGQRVRPGTPVGVQGDTGLSYGEHCHFEIRKDGVPVDPSPYIGVDNVMGAETKDYAAEICRVCGLERKTREYIDGYLWAADLWRKIYENLGKKRKQA